MNLTFLGTGAGRPTKARNVTSMALTLPGPTNLFWLFDAGEGTQHRLLSSKLKLNKLERIFITHLHGDHLFGLPGLLSSRTYFEGAVPLSIWGPPGIRAYLAAVFEHSGTHLEYKPEIIEITEVGLIAEDDRFTVETAELDHRLPSFGFRITEKPLPGQLNLEKLKELGVPPGPLYGRLKKGEDITFGDGKTIRSADVTGKQVHGRIVTILGDTSPCDSAIRLAQGADLVVHESTFAAGMEEKAAAYGHSTVLQAAQVAATAKAKRLAMTHFSSRYDDEAIAKLVQDAQTIFPNTVAAYDMLELNIPRTDGQS